MRGRVASDPSATGALSNLGTTVEIGAIKSVPSATSQPRIWLPAPFPLWSFAPHSACVHPSAHPPPRNPADGTGRKHTVITNEGTIDEAELARLKEEMLFGNGFIIAKGVVPPELCKACVDDLLSRGPEARRTSDILKYNDAFSEVLVHTWDRLGPLMEAIMGPRCFLNGCKCTLVFEKHRFSTENLRFSTAISATARSSRGVFSDSLRSRRHLEQPPAGR